MVPVGSFVIVAGGLCLQKRHIGDEQEAGDDVDLLDNSLSWDAFGAGMGVRKICEEKFDEGDDTVDAERRSDGGLQVILMPERTVRSMVPTAMWQHGEIARRIAHKGRKEGPRPSKLPMSSLGT